MSMSATAFSQFDIERSTYNVGVLGCYGSKDKQKRRQLSSSELKYASGVHKPSRNREDLYSTPFVMKHSLDVHSPVYAHW